jgi:outer membrane protein assembly factor BamB
MKRNAWLVFAAVLSVGTATGAYLAFFAGVSEVRTSGPPAEPIFAEAAPTDADWPWWRGTLGTQVVESADATAAGRTPLLASPEQCRWKTPLAGSGHSTPCLWSSKLFLSVDEPIEKSVSLLCVEAARGSVLWRTTLEAGARPEIHAKNTHASAGPATDGTCVYVPTVADETLWVSAVDFNGRVLWKKAAGPYASEWGYGSSPTLYQSLVIVAGESRGTSLERIAGISFLAALNRRTGEIVWRIKRPPGDSFGTPLVARTAGRDQLLLAGKQAVTAYDPLTGDELWVCRWSAERTANTVAFDERNVYASATHTSPEVVCIRADGSGEVTETHLVWRQKKGACDVPSPVVHHGRLYLAGDDGVLACLDAGTGKQVWQRRLGGNFSASPLLVGRQLVCGGEDGALSIVALDDGRVIARQTLDGEVFASPVFAGNRLYLRTTTHLICYQADGTREPAATAAAPRLESR